MATDLYATVGELKNRFAIDDSIDDSIIDQAIAAASRAIDKVCGRRFYADDTATARVYYPDESRLVEIDDVHTSTGFVLKTDDGDDGTYETTWTSDEYQAEPLNGIVDGESGWPFYRLRAVEGRTFPIRHRRAPIQVTAQWGWASVPDDIKEATLISASELFKLKDAPFGVAGFGDFGSVRVRDNPKITHLIGPYRRYPIKVTPPTPMVA